MIDEQDVIDEFYVLIGKIALLSKNRSNNSEFWNKISKDVSEIVQEITKDKLIYGW